MVWTSHEKVISIIAVVFLLILLVISISFKFIEEGAPLNVEDERLKVTYSLHVGGGFCVRICVNGECKNSVISTEDEEYYFYFEKSEDNNYTINATFHAYLGSIMPCEESWQYGISLEKNVSGDEISVYLKHNYDVGHYVAIYDS